MARLIVESGADRREVAVGSWTVIGRLKTCALPLEDKTVSREHVRVWQDGLRYLVQDLGSKSGTFLNGRRLMMPASLSHGDTLKVGPFKVRFELTEEEQAQDRTWAATPPGVAPTPSAVSSRRASPAGGRSAATDFLLYVVLLTVFVGVAWASRFGFGRILDKVLS